MTDVEAKRESPEDLSSRYSSSKDFDRQLGNPDLPKTVNEFGEKVLEWLDPSQEWVITKARVGIVNIATIAEQQLDDYLQNGPSDKSPEKFKMAFLLKSPMPPIQKSLIRSLGGQVDVQQAINPSCILRNTVEFRGDKNKIHARPTLLYGGGFFGIQPLSDALRVVISPFYLERVYFTNHHHFINDFTDLQTLLRPQDITCPYLFAVIELGDLYHYTRRQEEMAVIARQAVEEKLESMRKARQQEI